MISNSRVADRTGIGPAKRERDVELGMIGLGRMGANMVERLVPGGNRQDDA
jgi:hypothetical protein